MNNYALNIIASVFSTCYEKNTPYVSNFLNLEEQELYKLEAKKYPSLNLTFDGGINGSEYQKVIITPIGMNISSKIDILKISFNPKYLTLSHRNVLGTLIHLGISRDRIGDIVIYEDKVYVAVSDTITNYIIENLTTIHNQPVTISKTYEQISLEDKGIEKTIFIQSNRLDAIIAMAYNISREESSELIKRELVKVNQKVTVKSFQNLKPCDIISVAHKGRVKILDDSNTSRSGRIVMKIKIYR